MRITNPTAHLIRPRRTSDLWTAEPPDGVLVLSDAKLTLDQFHLNTVAGMVWKLCDGHHTVPDIARRIKSECNGSSPTLQTIQADVLDTLDSLRAEGLVSWSEADRLGVLLVAPPAPSVYARQAVKTPEYSAPPLGICYIAAVLREHGFRVGILDLHQTAGRP